MSVVLKINGRLRELDVPADKPLLWAIRDDAALNGTKFGCGVGVCGSCTVNIDGTAVRSCAIACGDAAGTEITTIEGLGGTHPLQDAWIAEQVPQCGYCQPGMIMAVNALLKTNPAPTDAEIDDQITNVCRCGTYPRIRRAIHAAAKAMAGAKA